MDKFPYQLTDYMEKKELTSYFENFKRYKETSKCTVLPDGEGKYAIFTTGELAIGQKYERSTKK